MTRPTFRMLLIQLRPKLLLNKKMALRSSRGAVKSEVRLPMMLRMLAGRSYLDQMMTWGVDRSINFRVFLVTIYLIVDEIKMPGVMFQEESTLKNLADGFKKSREERKTSIRMRRSSR